MVLGWKVQKQTPDPLYYLFSEVWSGSDSFSMKLVDVRDRNWLFETRSITSEASKHTGKRKEDNLRSEFLLLL